MSAVLVEIVNVIRSGAGRGTNDARRRSCRDSSTFANTQEWTGSGVWMVVPLERPVHG